MLMTLKVLQEKNAASGIVGSNSFPETAVILFLDYAAVF
jgi:hypothetical protein